MKKLLWIIPFLIIWSCEIGQPRVAKNNQQNKKTDITEIQSELIFEKAKFFPNNAQLSIAIIANGKAHFYGIKRKDDEILTVDNYNKVFEIGSITKLFTSTLLSGMVIEEKVGLDDCINDHLKFKIKDNQKITFKQLANHTSGLPVIPPNSDIGLKKNIGNPYKNYDEQKLKEYLTKTIQLGVKKMNYSNLGAALLSHTLCTIENKSYQGLLQERIFSKYNMKNSTTIRSEVENKLIKGLDGNGDITPNWDMAVHVGAGGVLSTAEDLSKFAIAQFDSTNKVLGLTRKKTFFIDDNQDIGLGWGIIKNKSKSNWYSHFGGTGGYSSAITIDPINRNGVIVLSNVSFLNKNQINIGLLSSELLKTLERK